MSVKKTKVLLVGEKPVRSSNLAEHLLAKGCECSFAASYHEARSHLLAQAFDLVISPIRLNNVTLFPLMDLLEGSETTPPPLLTASCQTEPVGQLFDLLLADSRR